MRKKLLYLLLLLVGFTIQAQQAVLGSGSDASGSAGSLSYSIGQVVYTTNSGSGFTLAQGVQQPTDATVSVSPITPTLTAMTAITKNYGDANFSLTPPTSASSGAITFTSSDLNVATISGTTVTIVGVGTATITATQAASGQFGRTIKTFQINVVDRFTITASAKNKVITVASSDPTARVSINNMNASLGKNTVKAGNQLVQVFIQGALAYSKKFVIKK